MSKHNAPGVGAIDGRTRRAERLSRGMALCAIAMVAASLVLLVLDARAIDSVGTSDLPSFLSAGVAAVLGALIASRRSGNPIGWLLLAISMSQAVSLTGGFLAMHGLLSGSGVHGWVGVSTWISNWSGLVGSMLLGFLVLFFPDGHLPGARWRWVAWVMVIVCLGSLMVTVLSTAPVNLSPRLPSVPALVVIPALSGFVNAGNSVINSVAFSLVFVVPIVAVVLRLVRAQGTERQQLKWFAYTAATAICVATAGGLLGTLNAGVGGTIANLGFGIGITVAIPAAIGLAVMKYGLYDIDLFISRTLVYGALAVMITAVYVGIAVGIGSLIGSGGKPNLALSILATAIVAVGFQPVRERVQRVANRLVYGKRATPYEVLSEFSGRVAETYAADEVLPRMARVLQEGTGAESATVWLRGTTELRPAATSPGGTAMHDPLPMSNGSLPPLPDATRAVEVRHQGELLGALSVTKRRGESLTPIEHKLVDDLAHQAGLVLKNVGLSADLQARLDELRASRQRLVSAQDLERRRLERNLHDGAQQHLVALKVKLGLAEMLLTRDPEKATATLEQLKHDADEALETLRDLARGIYPPLLADKGIVVALESQARKATIPVTVDADGVGRYSQDVEATAYFCVLEALQNVQKYAAASHAVVRLDGTDSLLRFAVEDDGKGFDPATVRGGSGLTNMSDRIDAVGGSLTISSTPGSGTTMSAAIPAAFKLGVTV